MVNQIYFTQEVEEAFQKLRAGNKAALKEYNAFQVKQLTKVGGRAGGWFVWRIFAQGSTRAPGGGFATDGVPSWRVSGATAIKVCFTASHMRNRVQ